MAEQRFTSAMVGAGASPLKVDEPSILSDPHPSMGRRARGSEDEPEFGFSEDEIEECGGELIYVVGHTSGGAPYGAPLRHILADMEENSRHEGWARAKRVLRAILELEGVTVTEIGRMTKVGQGLSRDVFVSTVSHDKSSQAYAVLIPRADADDELAERTLRELALVTKLRLRSFPFGIPAVTGAITRGKRAALVRHFVPGVPLDLRAGRQHSIRPWKVVGRIAAAIHGVPGDELADVTAGFPTRRAHALDRLRALEGLEPADIQTARAWALAHLPPDEPARLVHGDLLGQNILLDAGGGPHHVIDWEYALRGDPAYDLAVVTRGVKRPFQLPDGMLRFLEVYEECGGRGVTREHVHLHELCLFGDWYREALTARGGQPPEYYLDRIRGMMRWLA